MQERARERRFFAGAPPVTLCKFDLLVHNGRLTEKPVHSVTNGHPARLERAPVGTGTRFRFDSVMRGALSPRE